MEHEFQNHDDHEGIMAKSDLFKLAKYSYKLLQMIDDNEQLDGWVQEKITLAADHIGNVYHYLEYEKKKQSAIDRGPRTYEESRKHNIKSTLVEQWLQKKHKE